MGIGIIGERGGTGVLFTIRILVGIGDVTGRIIGGGLRACVNKGGVRGAMGGGIFVPGRSEY